MAPLPSLAAAPQAQDRRAPSKGRVCWPSSRFALSNSTGAHIFFFPRPPSTPFLILKLRACVIAHGWGGLAAIRNSTVKTNGNSLKKTHPPKLRSVKEAAEQNNHAET